MLEFSLVSMIIAMILLPIGLYLKWCEFRERESELEMEIRHLNAKLKNPKT